MNSFVSTTETAKRFGNVLRNIEIQREDSDMDIIKKFWKYLLEKKELKLKSLSIALEKSQSLADAYRSEGDQFYDTGEYGAALLAYNKGICIAPRQSQIFGILLSNRCTVLYQLKLYKDCLNDTSSLLRTQYPENRKYRIYLRRAKCFRKLQLYSKAREEMSEAMACVPLSERNSKEMFDAKLEISGMPIIDAPLFEEDPPLPELKDGESRDFAYASAAVKLEGDGVFANADINTGDVLFVEEPSAYLSVDEVHTKVYCDYCSKLTATFIPCITCKYAMYCSEQCRALCWELCHKWECEAMRRHLLHFEQLLALNLLCRASHHGLNTAVKDEHRFGDRTNNYPYIFNTYHFRPNLEKLKLNGYLAVKTVIYLKHYTRYFSWLYSKSERPPGSMVQLYHTVGEHLLRHLNHLELYEPIPRLAFRQQQTNLEDNVNFHVLGHGVYPSSRLIELSCVANTVESFYGNVKVVRAVQPIRNGEKITVKKNSVFYLSYAFSCLPARNFSAPDINLLCGECTQKDRHVGHFHVWKCKWCTGMIVAEPTEELVCMHCSRATAFREVRDANDHITNQLAGDLSNVLDYDSELMTRMNLIYHRSNLQFGKLYRHLMSMFRKKGEYAKSVEVAQMLTKLYEILDEKHLLSIGAHYQLCVSMVIYSVKLRSSRPDFWKGYCRDTREMVAKLKDMLEYTLDPRAAKALIKVLLQYLDATSTSSLKSVLLQNIF